jgi:hypothetical protein
MKTLLAHVSAHNRQSLRTTVDEVVLGDALVRTVSAVYRADHPPGPAGRWLIDRRKENPGAGESAPEKSGQRPRRGIQRTRGSRPPGLSHPPALGHHKRRPDEQLSPLDGMVQGRGPPELRDSV